jgi:hypothetical protein
MIAMVEERIERSSYYRKLLGESQPSLHMPKERTRRICASHLGDVCALFRYLLFLHVLLCPAHFARQRGRGQYREAIRGRKVLVAPTLTVTCTHGRTILTAGMVMLVCLQLNHQHSQITHSERRLARVKPHCKYFWDTLSQQSDDAGNTTFHVLQGLPAHLSQPKMTSCPTQAHSTSG